MTISQAPVVQFEITGKDSATLQRFYASLFGWEPQHTGTPGYARILAKDSRMSGAIGNSWDGGSGGVTVYVEVSNLQQTFSLTEQLGGTVIGAPTEDPPQGVERMAQWSQERRAYEVPQGGIGFAFIADPEGHVVGISQGLQPALAQFAARR